MDKGVNMFQYAQMAEAMQKFMKPTKPINIDLSGLKWESITAVPKDFDYRFITIKTHTKP